MPAQPPRLRRPDLRAGARPVERRGWLSHGVAALAVSALGLAVAGSITSTTSAQPLAAAPVPARTAPAASPAGSATPAGTFDRTTGTTAEPLREAIVAERAAQRAEQLAKDADAVSRSARTATSQERQRKLDAESRATQAKAEELARVALERAAAARAAASQARTQAEAAAQQQPTTPTAPSAPSAPSAPAAPAPGSAGGAAVAPVPNAVIGAGFGEYGLWSRWHTGLDFRAAYGVPIRAVKDGKVLFAGNSGDWAGNHVAVQHGDGMTTMSSHMSRMTVTSGQTVRAGQVIGYVGQTGRAFGAHLHFELYPAGVAYGDVYRAVNPVPWLRAAGVTTR